MRLGVNIDHVATIRNARGETYPNPVQAAVMAELGGADNITCHLREDRRHIRDADVRLLRDTIQIPLNFEIAATEEMVSYASDGPKLYFGCSSGSLKAANLARDDRVAVTVTLPYRDWAEIRGLSARGRARRLTSEEDIGRVGLLFMGKFSEVAQYITSGDAELALFEVTFDAVGLLDYRQGFGHVEHLDA